MTSIHEASHVTEAIDQGFRVYGVMFDGPEDHAGCIWRVFPEGKSAETHPDWARKELAVFCAGYMGEREFYQKNDPRYLVGPDGDTAMTECMAFHAADIKPDAAAVNAALAKGHIPRDETSGGRKCLTSNGRLTTSSSSKSREKSRGR
jgi:hypothetical protein